MATSGQDLRCKTKIIFISYTSGSFVVIQYQIVVEVVVDSGSSGSGDSGSGGRGGSGGSSGSSSSNSSSSSKK